jgi:hypothetical protein
MRQAQYSNKVQQRPLTTASQHERQHTDLAGMTDNARLETVRRRVTEIAQFYL